MLIDLIAGNKPDLYKVAPVLAALQKEQDSGADIGYRLIYTHTKNDPDQEHDAHVPAPNIFLDATEESPAMLTAAVMVRYEKLLATAMPEIVMIFGHSTGAMACTLAASKMPDLRIAHIGSGIRSYHRNAEDEINRRIIDSITDYHFTISQSSGENMRNEGVADDYVFFVGNPIADFLHTAMPGINPPGFWDLLHLQPQRYILLQLEHPLVAGSPSRLKNLLLTIIRLSKNLPIIIPANPVSSKTLNTIGIKAPNLHIVNLPDTTALYYLAKHSKVTITDTEQLQDETTIMQVPCMTLLKSIARYDTYTGGFNEIVGMQTETITAAFHKLFNGEWKKGRIPYFWDGKSAERIIAVLRKLS